jgi:hypothetical protein
VDRRGKQGHDEETMRVSNVTSAQRLGGEGIEEYGNEPEQDAQQDYLAGSDVGSRLMDEYEIAPPDEMESKSDVCELLRHHTERVRPPSTLRFCPVM